MSNRPTKERIYSFNGAGDLISGTTPRIGPVGNRVVNSFNCSNSNNNRKLHTRWSAMDRHWRDFDNKTHSSLPSIIDIEGDPYISMGRKQQVTGSAKDGKDGIPGPQENVSMMSLDSITLDQIWSTFAKQSTCHGLKNVVETCRRPWMRIAWLLIVLAMLIILISTVIALLDDYQNHSTVTRTDVRIQTKPDFPSVTICNNSPFKNLNGTLDNPMFTLMAKHSLLRHVVSVDHSDPEVLNFLKKSGIEVNEAYSFTKDDLLKLATYEQQDLNISRDFETVDTPSGRCFSFNGPKYIAKNGVRKTSFDGRKSGLRVVVDIKQDMYLPTDGLNAGIRVFVSSHPDTPRFEKDGLDILPGTTTRVALRPVKYQFLPYPYSSFGSEYCQNIKEGEMLEKMMDAPFYSQHSCHLQCQMFHASRMCNCYTYALYVKGLPPCSFGQDLYCIMEKINQMKGGNVNVSCDCPRPCTFTLYNSVLSASLLSSKPTLKYLRQMVNASSVQELRDNYIEVRVFLDSMLTMMETHEPRYTLSSVLGFLGGQMGLFMGASLMSIVELGETLFLTTLLFIRKMFRMGQMK